MSNSPPCAAPVKLVLADADVISKLAHWRLLDALPVAFECTWNEIATLPSLAHRARRAASKPDRLFRSSVVAIYAAQILAKMSIAPQPNADVVQELQRIPQIDAGEAVLLGILCVISDGQLATGDKRALVAIAEVNVAAFQCHFSGRLICLEQVLSKMITTLGFGEVRRRIVEVETIDQAIANCFGRGFSAPEASVLDGLTSYTRELRSLTGELLVR